MTQEQKKEIFIEMLKEEDPVQVLTYMLIVAGEYAADTNAGELELSTEFTRNNTSYSVKMKVDINEIDPSDEVYCSCCGAKDCIDCDCDVYEATCMLCKLDYETEDSTAWDANTFCSRECENLFTGKL